jgi:DNA-binding CsgD family transcriptional regulator
VTGSSQQARLLERDSELGVVESLVARLTTGAGGLLVVEGLAGIGKTALLAELRERADATGARVLAARGGELESDDAYGVLAQLFGPPLAPDVLTDLPVPALAALGSSVTATAPPGEDAARVVYHALFGVCARLAADEPLAVVVDDAHWADERSLRWLLFLARRIDRAPILLALARRPREPGADRDLVDRIATLDGAEVIRPAPLSAEGTAAVVRAAMGDDADPEFCEACRRATGGNPFLLRALVTELWDSGVVPTAEAAELALSVGPESVARATLLRVARLPPAALPLARALAILGDADLRDAARLAQLDDDAAVAAAGALSAAGLLADGPRLRFAHPLLRSAIDADIDEHARGRSHRDAADVLAAGGASPERVAAHLLNATASGNPKATAALRAAARRAYANGAAPTAARYLRRALEEPPADDERASVLLELGRAEVRASEPDAVAHLEEAVAAAGDDVFAARALRELARAHMVAGRMAEAGEAFEAAVGRAVDDRELRLALEGEHAATLANVTDANTAAARLAPYRDVPGETPAERTVLALLAFTSVQTNQPVDVAHGFLERALSDGRFVAEQTAATVTFADGVLALLLAEREERALEVLEPALADMERLGWTIGLTAVPCFQSWAHLRLGNLEAARERGRAALAVSGERGWQALTPMAAAVLCETEIERGDLAAAAAALDGLGLPDDVPDSSLFQLALYARGLLRAARGEAEPALADVLLCGEREVALGGVTPAAMAWRSHAALLHARLGDRAAAEALAGEELELARALGASRALGIALRAHGIVHGGGAGLAALEEAEAVLRDSGARLEHARALCELGAALRRANRRRDAREPLREALALADAAGAEPLAARARDELHAAGARPRRSALQGADALTASELRVAQLAAEGKANRAIAAELFVTVRTVEFHLSRAYAKLGIGSRAELADALRR